MSSVDPSILSYFHAFCCAFAAFCKLLLGFCYWQRQNTFPPPPAPRFSARFLTRCFARCLIRFLTRFLTRDKRKYSFAGSTGANIRLLGSTGANNHSLSGSRGDFFFAFYDPSKRTISAQSPKLDPTFCVFYRYWSKVLASRHVQLGERTALHGESESALQISKKHRSRV